MFFWHLRGLVSSQTRPEANLDAPREAKEAKRKLERSQRKAKTSKIKPNRAKRRPKRANRWHKEASERVWVLAGPGTDSVLAGPGGLLGSFSKADKKQAKGKESKKRDAVNPKHA